MALIRALRARHERRPILMVFVLLLTFALPAAPAEHAHQHALHG